MRYLLLLSALLVAVVGCGGPETPSPTPTAALQNILPTSVAVATTAPSPSATTAPPTAPPGTPAAVVTATPELAVTVTPPSTEQAVATAEAQGATPKPAPPVQPTSNLVGTYAAILPAADAPGRIVTLELALDGTATMTTQFIGRGGASVETGTWTAQEDRAIAVFTIVNGKPEDNRVTWTLQGTELASTEFDPASYGTAGLPLMRVGTRDIKEATFSGVSFSYDSSLAKSAEGSILAARPVENAPGLGGGAPQGVRFVFNGDALPDYFDPQRPQLYVYPVAGLQQLDPSVAAGIQSLKELLTTKPMTPTADIFVFPLIPAAQGMRTQVRYLNFVNGQGVRFVTYYSQDASPVTNDRVFYTFQGLTLDGQYFVSASWPVQTPALPDANAPAPDLSTADKFESYLQGVVSTLNSLPPAGFAPNLTLLDNLVQSINAAPQFPTPTPQATGGTVVTPPVANTTPPPQATAEMTSTVTSAPTTTVTSAEAVTATREATVTVTAAATVTVTGEATATVVSAATVTATSAATATVETLPTAPAPTPTPGAAAPSGGLVGELESATFEGATIRFFRSLAGSSQGTRVPAVAVDPNAPMLGGGAPEHIAFAFNGQTAGKDVDPFQPAVRIYPVSALNALDPAVAREVQSLKSLLAARPATVTDTVPVFPLFNAQQVIHPQVKYLTFAGGAGVRFVAFYAQNIGPITNSGLFYTFQGLSTDEKYLVTVFWPLRTDRLPETFQDANITDMDAFAERYEQYVEDTAAMLNGLAPNAFQPDLILLDALARSIQLP